MTDKEIVLAPRRAWVECHFHQLGLTDEEVMDFRPLPSENFNEGFFAGVAYSMLAAEAPKPTANISKKHKGLYRINKEAKVGETIECPVCHTKFTKRQYSQAFCCGQCKDKFHNMRCKDRHCYDDTPEDSMTDHDWDEAFGVAEYNDAD